MIKKLRSRFILVAMLCMMGVMVVIASVINLSNYLQTVDTAYQTIELLTENREQGAGPDEFHGEKPGNKPENKPNQNGEVTATDKENRHPEKPDEERKNFSPEKPFSARYFTVLFNEKGEVIKTDISNTVSVDEATAEEMAKERFSQGKQKGVANPFVFQQIPSQEGVCYLFLNCEDDFSYFYSFLWTSIGVCFGGIALVFALVCFFSGMVMKPIAESYEKQKRFITDAGHELKTPLTIIDANAEVLEMERGESPWIESIRNQIKRLSGLTQQLVFLSRMEEEKTPLCFTEFSLTDAVLETAKPFLAVAAAKGKTLEISCKEGVSYKGDEATLRQLISLLLDNAMKYSNDNGTIAVALTENGKKKQLAVTNTVEKVGTTSPALWFDRFYRQETSRNSATGGHGIGLSVAQAIVNAHKGKISAAYQNGNQVVITVIL